MATGATGTRPAPAGHAYHYLKVAGFPIMTHLLKSLLSRKLLITALAVSACGAFNAGKADAILVYELIQQGPDVQVNLSGSLSGISVNSTGFSSYPNIMIPGQGFIYAGVDFAFDAYDIPVADRGGFGVNSAFNISSYAGMPVVLVGIAGELRLPSGYIQGSSISGSGLILGQNLTDFGLSSTTGLLKTYNVGSDMIQVWAGPATSAVPGPLPLLGAAAAFAQSRRLRARMRARSSPQA
jgi:hypothetical protein